MWNGKCILASATLISQDGGRLGWIGMSCAQREGTKTAEDTPGEDRTVVGMKMENIVFDTRHVTPTMESEKRAWTE